MALCHGWPLMVINSPLIAIDMPINLLIRFVLLVEIYVKAVRTFVRRQPLASHLLWEPNHNVSPGGFLECPIVHTYTQKIQTIYQYICQNYPTISKMYKDIALYFVYLGISWIYLIIFLVHFRWMCGQLDTRENDPDPPIWP